MSHLLRQITHIKKNKDRERNIILHEHTCVHTYIHTHTHAWTHIHICIHSRANTFTIDDIHEVKVEVSVLSI